MKLSPSPQQNLGFLFFGILLVSFNLRPSITAVGPLIPLIREDLGLSNGWAGFLTTLPLLTFATFSLFAAGIGKRLGLARAIFVALFVLLVGSIWRVSGGKLSLFLGTSLTGIGIVICNVLLIPLIKKRLPGKLGLVTASYTTGMSLFAAIGSGISAPLATDWSWGWRGSLLFWVGLLIVGLAVWFPQISFDNEKSPTTTTQSPKVNVWKSRLAWNVCLFMGVQSMLYFTIIAWLPDMLVARGYSLGRAGLILSLMQVVGLLGSFFAPMLAVRFRDQVGMVIGIGLMYLLGFSSLLSTTALINYAGLTLAGLGLGASVSLAYTMIGLRTDSEQSTTALSGMVQSTGYYMAALGPVLFGIAFDVFGDLNLLIGLMLACSVLYIYFGTKSGKSELI
ncbi:CynX/NimT family MFS transporter [Mariniradius sediminis]|uniref:MFS transporter n=1 Tax=Mariniradius sediminis TaxID=2909237 RepID=A0ABS9BVE3_9BACT|nr:MFS transporter [Mariniradius sediminis]MCF1752038.1 MFS transporter [Mariniradius sediminis]